MKFSNWPASERCPEIRARASVTMRIGTVQGGLKYMSDRLTGHWTRFDPH